MIPSTRLHCHFPTAFLRSFTFLILPYLSMRVFAFAATVLLLQPTYAESVTSLHHQGVEVFYEPATQTLPNTKGSLLASLEYDKSTLENRTLVYSPPATSDATNQPETSHPLLRISTNSPDSSTTVTSLATFNFAWTQTLTLHLNDDGTVFAASFSADPLLAPPTSEIPKDKLKVVLLPPSHGPTPKLIVRKPVVVSADGKEVPQEPEVERSFFQKYWWAFALVAVLALAGGGDK
jgi:hypothetical protein